LGCFLKNSDKKQHKNTKWTIFKKNLPKLTL